MVSAVWYRRALEVTARSEMTLRQRSSLQVVVGCIDDARPAAKIVVGIANREGKGHSCEPKENPSCAGCARKKKGPRASRTKSTHPSHHRGDDERDPEC